MSIEIITYCQHKDIPVFRESNRFHSREMFEILEGTPGFTPFMFVAFENGKHLFHLLAIIQKDRRILTHTWIKRCVVYGNGDFEIQDTNRGVVFDLVLQQMTKTISGKAFITEFRNLDDSLFGYKSFRNEGYFPINWLRVHNSLHGDIPLERRISSSRLRQVRKGLKNGAIVYEAVDAHDIESFVEMLRKVYSSHIRKYFPDKRFFYHLFAKWSNEQKAKIFVVKYKDRIIGGSVCLYSNNNAYLWFSGGMRKTFAKQYPGVLAVWKALTEAKEMNCWHFEFLDAGLPFKKHGFRDFILRFGGKQSSTRRWFRFRWHWLNKLCVRLYS